MVPMFWRVFWTLFECVAGGVMGAALGGSLICCAGVACTAGLGRPQFLSEPNDLATALLAVSVLGAIVGGVGGVWFGWRVAKAAEEAEALDKGEMLPAAPRGPPPPTGIKPGPPPAGGIRPGPPGHREGPSTDITGREGEP